MNVVELRKTGAQDVVAGLRALADTLESNGRVTHGLAYVIDLGDGVIDIGLLGHSPEPASTAYFMYGLGKRKLEDSV